MPKPQKVILEFSNENETIRLLIANLHSRGLTVVKKPTATINIEWRLFWDNILIGQSPGETEQEVLRKIDKALRA